MLDHRQRPRPSIKPELADRFEFAVWTVRPADISCGTKVAVMLASIVDGVATLTTHLAKLIYSNF